MAPGALTAAAPGWRGPQGVHRPHTSSCAKKTSTSADGVQRAGPCLCCFRRRGACGHRRDRATRLWASYPAGGQPLASTTRTTRITADRAASWVVNLAQWAGVPPQPCLGVGNDVPVRHGLHRRLRGVMPIPAGSGDTGTSPGLSASACGRDHAQYGTSAARGPRRLKKVASTCRFTPVSAPARPQRPPLPRGREAQLRRTPPEPRPHLVRHAGRGVYYQW